MPVKFFVIMAKCREAAREVKPLIVKMISGDTSNYIV